MSAITTHVLDTAVGRPVSGVPIVLEYRAPEGWQELDRGVTDQDGRLRLLQSGPGEYRLTFDTRARSAFFPTVTVHFAIGEPSEHCHVPLLLSPFGYSTYRGS